MIVELPLVTGGRDEVSSWLRSERINVFPEQAPSGARSKWLLRSASGLTSFYAGTGAHRGAHTMGEVLYIVNGQSLSSISEAGVRTYLGDVLGSDRVSMTDGFVPATSRQLIVATGERGYIYDTVTGFAEIVAANFTTYVRPTTVVWVGGYYVWPTDDGIRWSTLNDPASYPALHFRTAETVTDGVVGIAKVYGDVWILGQRSIEVVQLSGQANENAFSLAQTIDYGAAGPYGCVNADNGFFFLEAKGRVYRANGYNPARVSDFQLEQYLATQDLSDAWMFSYVDRGHEFVGLTIPGGETHVFDIASGLWSRRKSFTVDRWRVNTHTRAYGKNLFGDYQSGTVWELDSSNMREGSDHFVREVTLGYVHQDTSPLFFSMLEAIYQTGEAAQTGTTSETAPVVEMSYSDDGGHNFKAPRQASLGAIGEYLKRVRFPRLGRTFSRVFRLRISDPVRADLMAVYLNGEPGA